MFREKLQSQQPHLGTFTDFLAAAFHLCATELCFLFRISLKRFESLLSPARSSILCLRVRTLSFRWCPTERLNVMTVTPRRSVRGALRTPSPHPSPALIRPDTTYAWTAWPLPSSPNSLPHYNSFIRIISGSGLRPQKSKARAGKSDEDSRFTVGDGVMVSVEGGSEGVGVLIRLWEEREETESDGEEEDEEEEEEEEERGPMMMAEVHWCFRRQDLPGVMKNLSVEDVRRSASSD